MADIELVIKISKEDFEIMKHNIAVNNPLCPLSQEEMVYKVASGIPLPPVTPQLKAGEWLFIDEAHEHARCSKCDYGDVDLMDGKPHNYCPNCGSYNGEIRK